jgi:predicted phosphodiesterase
MRYAIISDIHGNLEALQAVLRECSLARAQALLCTGDIVGYGANPKECLAIIRQFKIIAVAGNHDWAVGGRLDFSHFTDDGRAAVEWTRGQISMEDIAYLNGLELSVKNKDCILVHSSLYEPGQFIYVTSLSKAAPSFPLMDIPVCFIGHTHVPGVFVEVGGKNYCLDHSSIEVEPGYKYIVNVGSVGQPRDGNPMASFCIYDTQFKTIELRRVPYTIQEAQRKILEAGLPRTLATRLAVGR